MSRIRSLVLLAGIGACIFVGCNDPNRAKIVGTWTIQQADTVMSRVNAEEESPSSDTAQISDAGESSKMQLVFRQNGVVETQTKMGQLDQTKKGNWKLVSFDDSSKTMTITTKLMDQETETAIKFLEEDLIRLVPPNMAGLKMKLKFKRQ
jgi:hypothetical protein